MAEIPEDIKSPDYERLIKAERLVNSYMLGSAGVGLIPIPVVDFAALSALQVKMLHSLTKLYNMEFQKDRATYIISSLVGGVLPTGMAGGVARAVAVLPVVGPMLGAITMPALAGASTYALSRVIIQHLESGGTFLTFDPNKVKDYFKEQFEAGKAIVVQATKPQDAVQEATAEAE